jgi:hypothetical protein
MNMSLVQSIRLAALLIFTSLAASALDIGRIPIPQIDQAGLQVSLVTSGYKFDLSATRSVFQPAKSTARSAVSGLPLRDSFAASAVVFNRSNGDIGFTFPSPGAAARRFTFRVFDSAGKQVWQSDADTDAVTEPTNATLPRHGIWRRTVRVPLFLEGKALPLGVYTLQALVEADKQPGATAVFEVVAVPPDTNVGLRALVLRPTSPVTPLSPIPAEAPAVNASVHFVQVGGPVAAAPFEWTGRTDSGGRFTLSIPPGTFRVTIDALPGADYPPSDPRMLLPVAFRLPPTLPKTVDIIAAEHYTETQTLIHLSAQPNVTDPRLIYSVTNVTYNPFIGGEQVTVVAQGIANTSGWTEPTLRLRRVLEGVLEFDFVAVRPKEASLQVLTPISATTTVTRPPNFTGARVFAETNSKEAFLK